MSVRQRLLSSAQAIICNQALNAVIQLLGLRIFILLWGTDVYGEWLTLVAIASAITMSDFGIAAVTGNTMTVYFAGDKRDLAKSTYEGSWFLFTLLTSIITLALVLLTWISPVVNWLPFRMSQVDTICWTMSILFIQGFVSMQTTMIYACFRSTGHQSVSINLESAAKLGEFLAQILAVSLYGSFVVAALAGLIVRVIHYLVSLKIQHWVAPWLKSNWTEMNLRFDRTLIRPALASTAFPFGHFLCHHASLTVVGSILGTPSVTILTAHRTLANIASQLVQTVGYSVSPEFSLAFGAGNRDLALRLHRRSCQLSISLGIIGCIMTGIVSKPLLEYWTQGRIGFDGSLMLALLCWVALRSVWGTSLLVAMSVNLHHQLAIVYVIGTLLSLLIAVPLTEIGGLPGTVIALCLAEVAMGYFVLRTSLKLVGDSAISFWGYVIRYGS